MDRSDLHREYQARLHAIGVPGADVCRHLALLRAIDAALDAGRCPECAAVIAPHERLQSAGPGTAWYGYVCVCGYPGTRIEPEN